ncbi:hypothetical protein SAMN04488550_1783 [Gordonia malaquae]|uniref:Uncharacterized protein n=1 Tax=Gordonia malaquae NBRC 108250 TaxID=1223542 RepID=M3UVZ5_GORML|nr:hypothetical protein [Gordonia malaquae]GAC79752.1 hypothetical protein GM1_012_00250 [Gordonia malaquae NBRC 108250]SEC41291.1 hypothetical protein SAMN04488550_1783 [Gordonia malaquae]
MTRSDGLTAFSWTLIAIAGVVAVVTGSGEGAGDRILIVLLVAAVVAAIQSIGREPEVLDSE